MTSTFPLQPQEEARLVAAAEAKGVSTTTLVRDAVDRILAELAPVEGMQKDNGRPIWEVILDNMNDVSAESMRTEKVSDPRRGCSRYRDRTQWLLNHF